MKEVGQQYPEGFRDDGSTAITGETLLRLIARPLLYILFVAAPRQLAQRLAIWIAIQVVDQDFELPVLKGPEIQIVRRNQRAILRLGFEMQGGNEFIALNDDIRWARVVVEEGTEKILIERNAALPLIPSSPVRGLIT